MNREAIIKSLQILGGFLLGLMLLVLLLMLAGCRKSIYVPVESVRTEYRDAVRDIHTTDSVVDTRYVYVNGDTVVDYRDRIKWRDREVHDTIYIERADSVAVPLPVEKELSKWERTKIDYGGTAMLASVVLAVGLCASLVWLIKKKRK